MGVYISADDLRLRLSEPTYLGIFDDDNDGTADATAVAATIRDAEAYVNGYLRGVYTIPLSPVPDQAKRISLDVAEMYAYARNRAFTRGDVVAMQKAVREELMDIRKGVIRLDIEGLPEPAANQGGDVRSGDPDYPEPRDHVFLNGTGWF